MSLIATLKSDVDMALSIFNRHVSESLKHVMRILIAIWKGAFVAYIVLFLLNLTAVGQVLADSTTIRPTKVAYTFQYQGDTNYGGYTVAKVGSTELNNDYCTWVQFDLSSIPSGSQIDSAYLRLKVKKNNGSGIYVKTRMASSSWSETGITWNNHPNVCTSPSDSEYISGTGWEEWAVTEMVRKWIDGTRSNYGFGVWPSNWNEGSNHWFYSDNDSNSSNHPQLVVNYTPPSPAPDITDYGIDKTSVVVGELFKITVKGKNIGNATASYGGIAVQVRQAYTDGVEVTESHVASGASSGKSVWWKGEQLGTPHTAEYLHAEPTWHNWAAGSTKTLEVTITPKKEGTYDIYTKMYLTDGTSFPRDPSGSTPNTDHQGEATIKVGTVYVPSITLAIHLISDTSGTKNTSNPGNTKSKFKRGETVRVTLKASNTGGSVPVQSDLNIRDANDSDPPIYDSNTVGENNSADSPLNNGETDYYSFDWTIPANAPLGWYDLLGSIRDSNDWDTVYDTIGDGANDENFEWQLDQFRVGEAQPTLTIPILSYHKVDNLAPTEYWLTTHNFDSQIAALKAYGYKTVSLEDVYKYIGGTGSLPSKPVVITFDDGYQNFYTKAYPILNQYGFKATNFIITNYIGESESERHNSNEWEPDTAENEERNYPASHLLWSEIQTMKNNGMIFEAHPKTHRDLTSLSASEAEDEIAGSKAIIESKLGTSVNFFSYPFILSDSTIENLVLNAGYHGAVTVNNQLFNTSTGNLLQIDRIDIEWNDSVDYDSSFPDDFFMTKIDPSFQVLQITIDSIDILHPTNLNPITSIERGDEILIRVKATNSGDTTDVKVNLNIDDDNDHDSGIIYDSHQTTPEEDIVRSFNAGQQTFDWLWVIPENAKYGQYYTAIGFHDDKYVLGYQYSGWQDVFALLPRVPKLVSVLFDRANNRITFEFNNEMDCISVQDAFSIMNGSYTWTGKDGVWECHGKVIHFIPTFNVEIGENYVI